MLCWCRSDLSATIGAGRMAPRSCAIGRARRSAGLASPGERDVAHLWASTLAWGANREEGVTTHAGWSTGTPEFEEASWRLIHFIRHLADVSEAEIEEMKALNPRSPADIRQEIEAEYSAGRRRGAGRAARACTLANQDAHAHAIMGQVTARDAEQVKVRTPSGEILSIAITEGVPDQLETRQRFVDGTSRLDRRRGRSPPHR